jgi:hypothetical protein
MPVRRAITALSAWLAAPRSGSGLATLLGSPPRPRIARRLLIGSERPAAAGLELVWPSGVALAGALRDHDSRFAKESVANASVECQADA